MNEIQMIDTPVGKQQIDSEGSPVGVVHLDPNQSYVGTGELLQDFINTGNDDSWKLIKVKIDYTYENLSCALSSLETETGFSAEIRARLDQGQKLLFKPNLVIPLVIDPMTHGPVPTGTACTEWLFLAALLRWFHDNMGVSYHEMTVGEAASAMQMCSRNFSKLVPDGKGVTTEAVIEGRSGEFYGGWGFYFARKYLSESLRDGDNDNPMNGYDESVSGTYIPPGEVTDKLMVYDLNRLSDDESKGREVEVPGGVNYQHITLHKAIIGGNPDDVEDMQKYPGCILVNVPKFKVHSITLFTNVIKNLGIGLYPMQFAKRGGHQWDYSVPHNELPGLKGGIPHEVWVPELDKKTGLTRKDSNGNYLVKKTGGITATMIDIIKAVSNQGIFMLHVVDGIEAINLDHTGAPMAERVQEGLVFAGIDPVATDLLCARYMFSNVPIKEAFDAELDDGAGGYFPQAVPVAKVSGPDIVSEEGYDCPLARDICFAKAEQRGLGVRQYYVVGEDRVAGIPMVTVAGHLGSVREGVFTDHFTKTLYVDLSKMPWDLQKTTFSYLDAVDQLTGSSIKAELLAAADEDGDGILSYEEFGKKGVMGILMQGAGLGMSRSATEELGALKSGLFSMTMLKNSDPLLNSHGHDLFKELQLGASLVAAYRMSQMDIEREDPFLPNLTFGKGKWPSLQLARFFQIGMSLYGGEFPDKAAFPSLYGSALLYADTKQNMGGFFGANPGAMTPDILDGYIAKVSSGEAEALDFTFYVPEAYTSLTGGSVPNVESTNDPDKVYTVCFASGEEIWPEALTSN